MAEIQNGRNLKRQKLKTAEDTNWQKLKTAEGTKWPIIWEIHCC
jgi:hypothetical protein